MNTLKKITGKINNTGTCFLVNKNYILTARHCIENINIEEKVKVKFNNLSWEGDAILKEKLDRPLDFALLELEQPILNVKFFSMVNDTISRGDSFLTYGYPIGSSELGRIIEGTIDDTDIELRSRSLSYQGCEEIDLKATSEFVRNYDPGYIIGVSGAPILINNQIVGIAKSSLGDGIGIQKIENFLEYFKKYGIIYSEVSTFKQKMIRQSMKDVEMNIISKKYMPEVHIEINKIKDEIRYFSDPILFWKQLINKIENQDFSYGNSNLKGLNLPIIDLSLPREVKEASSTEDLKKSSDYINNLLKEKKKFIQSLSTQDKFLELYPDVNKKLYKSLTYKLHNNYFARDWEFDDFIKRMKIINSRVLMILDSAGQGKTTLLCDAVKNLFNKKNQLCIFLSGNKIVNGDISKTIDDEFLIPRGISSSDFFKKLDLLAKQDQKKFIFIIDGINENDNFHAFSINLERFIGVLLEYENINVILSCRKEYLDERFRNLVNWKDKENVYSIENAFQIENENLKLKSLREYFNIFDININSMAQEVEDTLLNDPLMLRFFCEAYRGKDYDRVSSIYKSELFDKYTCNKYSQIIERGYKKSELVEIFDEISKYMLENNQYNHVPMDELGNLNLIKNIIHEDVIFKEDLIGGYERGGNTAKEVVGFTFDEYRDFNLAWYMYENYSDEKILEKIETLKNTSTIEGVGKYIYYIAKNKNSQLIEMIEDKEWINEAFLEYLFLGEDSKITSNDLEKLEVLFNSHPEYTIEIFVNCLKRGIDKYKNLNINIIWEFIKNMNSKSYILNFLAIFQENKYRVYLRNGYYEKWPISEFFKIVKEDILPKDNQLAYKLLLITLPTPDDYDTYWKIRSLLGELHLKLKRDAVLILEEFLMDSNNNLLNSFLEELLEKGKINSRMSYLYRLEDEINEED